MLTNIRHTQILENNRSFIGKEGMKDGRNEGKDGGREERRKEGVSDER